MMRRRHFLLTSLAGVVVAPRGAGAQPARIPRVAVLWPATPSANFDEAFKQGLREHGYVEGRNVILEHRYGEGQPERMSEIADELMRMKVDVIVAITDAPILAVKQRTRSIPIVMVGASDPVGTGFVAVSRVPVGVSRARAGCRRSSAASAWRCCERPCPGSPAWR